MSDRLNYPIFYSWRLVRPDGSLVKFLDEGDIWNTKGYACYRDRRSAQAGINFLSWDVASRLGITFTNTGLRPVPWPITSETSQ